MDVKKAYAIAIKGKHGSKCVECCDFGDFYGFVFAPDKWDGGPFGGAYDTVDKKTGAISAFNPVTDFDLFDKATPIALSALTD